MRISSPSHALALALTLTTLLHATHALNTAKQRKFNLLAEMGYNPDGTPMASSFKNAPPDTSSLSALLKSKTSESGAASRLSRTEIIVPEYVTLPLDNFHASKGQDAEYEGSFANRYWVAESGYRPGGPVFVYDVGEADAEPNALFRLQNETSFFKQIVDEFGGIGVVWEHRFYGNSTPEPININTPPEVFKYLTTEQSLADVERFAKQFSRPNINHTLTPDATPWIFIGGSYPGMRAAFMRNMYPDTIYAAYASSAPVQASIDQSFYFDPIWRGLNAKGFGNCTRDIQAAVRHMDDIMDTDEDAAAALKVQFLGLGAANNSHAGFADALTTIFYLWQSYGVEGGALGLRRFCDWMETDPQQGNRTAGAEGFAESKGVEYVVARWAAYPHFNAGVNEYLETECSGKTNVTGTCDLGGLFTNAESISWTWQYCTQWGYFQSANLGPNQLVSKYNSLDHQHDICHRQFPDAPGSLFPDWPLVDHTNRVFGGWSIRPSNTYWSNGEFDPWRTLSPASAEPFAPDVRVFAEPVPECGSSQSGDEVFGYVLRDAEHCFDFRTTGVTVPGGEISREIFKGALREWLGCFQGKPGYGRRWRA
ncbi:hypothetical protein IAQ61_010736 [Plenodomus lingam]|uniref:Serine peptidase n=1 Tax=Leptosphaeria maculans (strain JN3 / isolate v23.1.3 / race Av1-4-5-6-7-8) TaxID=985895 RepID=E4ZJU4_LEPMJ|nr:hypothetical protein LEMA_P068870.1 [Plenodomus lingam JN3]KAH9861000.1 hypothetical protein IAQ61_010736 [Plenodomus lingam]CBX91379.1 hypothetical protein LEMA_P068870.1 [Plenodomus lingam JN3]